VRPLAPGQATVHIGGSVAFPRRGIMASGSSPFFAGIVVLSLTSLPVAGQQVGIDLTVASRDAWRGLLRTSLPVVQGDGFVALPLSGSLGLTGGGWVTLEPFAAHGSSLTSCPGQRACIGEKRIWAELALNAGSASIHGGWSWYIDRRFPGQAGTSLGPRFKTHEITTSLWFPRVYLAPRLSASFDVDKVGGGYLEGALSVPVLGNINAAPFWALFLTAELGYSFGQSADRNRPENPFYYAGRGVTHLDLGLGSDLPIGVKWLSSAASLHTRVAVDDRTTRHGLKAGDVDRWLAFYARLSLSAPRWRAGR
jgi:hypothetical protein